MEWIKEYKDKLIKFITSNPNTTIGVLMGICISIFILLFGIKLIIMVLCGVIGYIIGRALDRMR